MPYALARIAQRPMSVGAVAALAAAALIAAGCGDSEEAPATTAAEPQAAVAIPLGQFDCQDWKQADAAARADVVVDLQAFAAGQVTGEGISGTGPVLESEQATELFDTRCRARLARGFLLYKLYFHAAALAGR